MFHSEMTNIRYPGVQMELNRKLEMYSMQNTMGKVIEDINRMTEKLEKCLQIMDAAFQGGSN